MRGSHARFAQEVFDPEFRAGAIRIGETGKPMAQIARDLGVHPGTLGGWVAKDRAEHEGMQGLSTDDVDELKWLRAENAKLRMEPDVLNDRWFAKSTRRRSERGRFASSAIRGPSTGCRTR